jgi:hypothetical protein
MVKAVFLFGHTKPGEDVDRERAKNSKNSGLFYWEFSPDALSSLFLKTHGATKSSFNDMKAKTGN